MSGTAEDRQQRTSVQRTSSRDTGGERRTSGRLVVAVEHMFDVARVRVCASGRGVRGCAGVSGCGVTTRV